MYVFGGIIFVTVIWLLYKLYNSDAIEIFLGDIFEYDEVKKILSYPKQDIIIANNFFKYDKSSYNFLFGDQKKIYKLIESLNNYDYDRFQNYVREITTADKSSIDRILEFHKKEIIKIAWILHCPDQSQIEISDKQKELYRLMQSLNNEEINELKKKIDDLDFFIPIKYSEKSI